MNEIKELLESWKSDGFVNPGALEKAYEAMLLLLEEIENLKK